MSTVISDGSSDPEYCSSISHCQWDCFFIACEHYGVSPSLPGNSCQDIYHNNPESQGASGEYYFKSGSDIQLQYSGMQLECEGKKGLGDGSSCQENCSISSNCQWD